MFIYFFKRKLPLLSLLDLGTPVKISYFWKFGSLLGLFCGVQIFSGVLLSMHYQKSMEMAFFSVKLSIQNEVFLGWFFHNVHSSGASFFFVFLYCHLFRGLYYGGFKQMKMWMSGVTMLLFSMALAFLGYVLPWGQMSFWGATVITNLFSAIPYVGEDVVHVLWGGYGVAGPTLNRFFSLHFLVPFLMVMVAFFHVFMFLHVKGSSNPLGGPMNQFLKIEFFPYFVVKDFFGIYLIFFVFFYFCLLNPRLLLDSENFIEANSLVTPVHIQPEWYFLSSYAILRSIPKKFGGVVALAFSVLFFYFFPFFFQNLYNNSFFKKNNVKFYFWFWLSSAIVLCYVGASPVEYPWVSIGIVFTFFYFSGFFFLLF